MDAMAVTIDATNELNYRPDLHLTCSFTAVELRLQLDASVSSSQGPSSSSVTLPLLKHPA